MAPSVKQPILQKDFYWAMHQVRPLNVWPQERLFIAVVPSVKQPILQKDSPITPMIHPYNLLALSSKRSEEAPFFGCLGPSSLNTSFSSRSFYLRRKNCFTRRFFSDSIITLPALSLSKLKSVWSWILSIFRCHCEFPFCRFSPVGGAIWKIEKDRYEKKSEWN